MRISVIGTGYVGLVTGACMAEQGHEVVCLDRDQQKIEQLKNGIIPFFEPELAELVTQGSAQGRLRFTTQVDEAFVGAELVFIAVGTPPDSDGAPNLSAVNECARTLASRLQGQVVVAIKSTVPPGTAERLQALIDTARMPASRLITIVSNPEFLAEGRAVEDFRRPERIVIGTNNARASARMKAVYQPFDPKGDRVLLMSPRSAEMAKYACNAMLAARIAMVNELARLAGCVDADMESLRAVVASDPRIGPFYLEAGVGYGGSCLPKDLGCLRYLARRHDARAPMLTAIDESNQAQLDLVMGQLHHHLDGALANSQIAVWGLAFKPDTDDIRASPSLALVHRLLAAGAQVQAYDPVAMEATRARLTHPRLKLAQKALQACKQADALVIMTQWPEFACADFSKVAQAMRSTLVIDGRQLYKPEALEEHGLEHRLPWQTPRRPLGQQQAQAHALGAA